MKTVPARVKFPVDAGERTDCVSPDSPEARLGRLETAVARLEQRTDDLATDVRTLAPLVVAVAEVKLTISQVQREQTDVHRAVEAISQRLDQEARDRAAEREKRTQGDKERRTEERRDSRNFRRTLIGIGIAAVLSPVATLVITLVSGAH
jgi:hypothetical protein